MFDYTVKDSPMTKRSYFTNKYDNIDILFFIQTHSFNILFIVTIKTGLNFT